LCIGPWDLKARDLCFVPRLLSGEHVGALASRLRTAIDHAQIEYVRYRAAITDAAHHCVAVA
jgi:hypothetical protein